MFDPIRKLISQNRLREALQACDELTLSASNRSQLIALRRRWDMIATDLISNTREERLIRIDENQLVQDLLAWLDHMDSDVQTEQREPAHQAPPTVEPKKKNTGRNIVLFLLLAVGLGLGGTYLVSQFWNGDNPAAKERTPSKAEELREPETAGEALDPTPGKTASDGPLMTSGPKVKLTTAVYLGRKSPTQYHDLLTKQVARNLSLLQSYSVPTDVLTKAFHSSDSRAAINLKGNASTPPALDANRARFLLLIDYRNVDRAGNGLLSLALYDVVRKRGFRTNEKITLEGDSTTAGRQLARSAHKYLLEMQERGLFK